MNERINVILNKIAELDDELRRELRNYDLQPRFVEQALDLKTSALAASGKLRTNILNSGSTKFLRHLLSVPFIYSMIIPLAFLDLTISLYQSICFRLYGIARVDRAEYFIIDRQYLDNLTGIDKFNCVYCGYGTGVIAFTREIISRTEQYWCPIKHAQKTHLSSERYRDFLEFGDTENYREKVAEYREQLRPND